MPGKLKPPHHWERQIGKYDRKIAAAKTPTQRAYALRMKRIAEQSLAASRDGVDKVEADDAIDLDPGDYREI